MSDIEFLQKYEELLDKDYCNCNEMNCIDNNSPRRILNIAKELHKENQKLKKQLNYLRSGEYLNQLRFERDMLQHVVDNNEVSKEDKEFIDMTHRNTELLAQQKEFITYLENKINDWGSENDIDYEAEPTPQEIFEDVLLKYKKIIGLKDE